MFGLVILMLNFSIRKEIEAYIEESLGLRDKENTINVATANLRGTQNDADSGTRNYA